jgi:hypothetical protein
MHDLSFEIDSLPRSPATESARLQALRLERREILSIRPELLVALYLGVAAVIAGVGLLVKANLARLGPLAVLGGICIASALCYAWVLRVRALRRERSIVEDYVLLLGALLASVALGYAETQFHLFGAAWSRHLLVLAAWHLASAYLLGSRMVLSVALMAFAAWLGVELRLGIAFEPRHALFGMGPRALLCALVFWVGARLHGTRLIRTDAGFEEVYRQFAVNFAFAGAIAMAVQDATRWAGLVLLLVLAMVVGRAGLTEKRESFVLYAVGYTTIGLVWFESKLLGNVRIASLIGLTIVVGAALLLLRLRARLKASTT